MNLSERCELLATAFRNTGLSFKTAADLQSWVEAELGGNALDGWIDLPSGRCMAHAPEGVYLIAASTLSVSALDGLLCGLVLGSKVYLKLPSAGLPEIERAINCFPEALKKRTILLREHDAELMKNCEAVIVMGSDETVSEIHKQVHWRQKFMAYGHKISCGLLPQESLSVEKAAHWARRAAEEILAYQQMGCLSPQAYLCRNSTVADRFIHALKEELQKKAPEIHDWDLSAAIFLARQEAALNGGEVFQSTGSSRWTVILESHPTLRSGPGGCFVRILHSRDFEATLLPWRNWLSSLSIASEEELTPWAERFAFLPVGRVCRMGSLQQPPVSWRHDGLPRLAPLVRWVYCDAE